MSTCKPLYDHMQTSIWACANLYMITCKPLYEHAQTSIRARAALACISLQPWASRQDLFCSHLGSIYFCRALNNKHLDLYNLYKCRSREWNLSVARAKLDLFCMHVLIYWLHELRTYISWSPCQSICCSITSILQKSKSMFLWIVSFHYSQDVEQVIYHNYSDVFLWEAKNLTQPLTGLSFHPYSQHVETVFILNIITP